MKKAIYHFGLYCLLSCFYFNAQAQNCAGNCLNLTNGGYVDVGANVSLNGANALTIEAWVYPTSFPTPGNCATIIGKTSTGGTATAANTSFWLRLEQTSLVGYFSNGTTLCPVAASNTLALNQWNHVAIVWATNTAPFMYINGVQVSTGGVIMAGPLLNNSTTTRIGTSSASFETGFRGYIDEVRIFKLYVGLNELNTYANSRVNGNHPYQSYLIQYNEFQEGYGTTTKNTVTGLSSSLSGSATWAPSLQPCNVAEIAPVYDLQQTGTALNKIALTWTYPYSYPLNAPLENDGSLFFDILRDGVKIYPVPNSFVVNGANSRSYSFVDSNITACSHTYQLMPRWVHVPVTDIDTGALSNAITGTTTNINFAASNGTYPNKTTLTWDNIAQQATGGYEIKRDGIQIGILTSPAATSYNDFDGIPGLHYQYEIVPILSSTNRPARVCKDNGWMKENGKLSGYVRSPLQAPVPDVVVTATATVLGQPYTYTDTTDASGFYEIRDVFYNTLATYTITPTKGTHQFNPPALSRTLDILAYNAPQANFIDTSVFTISGNAYFPNQVNAPGCPNVGVKILVNGVDVGIVTNALGNFTYTAQNEGNYTFTPQYPNHTFTPASAPLFVTSNLSNVNFKDNNSDSLWLDLKGYCNTQICDSATFTITGADGPTGCYTRTVTILGNTINGTSYYLPAQKYSVELTAVYAGDANEETAIINSFQSLGNRMRIVDLRNRPSITTSRIEANPPHVTSYWTTDANGVMVFHFDTIITYDTIVEITTPAAQAKYIYGGRLSIEVLGLDPTCGNNLVFAQHTPYNTRIKLWRNYKFSGGSTCAADTGELTFIDNISDSSLVRYTLDTSFINYQLYPGLPNTIGNGPHPYQKFLNMYATAWDAVGADTAIWATVLGNRALTSTFVTKTPELPLLVLHDPPGDNSFSTISKNTSVSQGYQVQIESGGGTNAFVNVRLAAEIPTPFTGIVYYAGGAVDATFGNTKVDTKGESMTTTFTMNQDYSTSSNTNFVGEDADLVMGMSFNMIYGVSFIVDYDSLNCAATLDTTMTWGAGDFATTYTYTIGHIKNTIIPQLNFLITYYQGIHSDSVQIYQRYKNVWQQVVDQNHARIAQADFKQNRSFSAGTSYTYTSSEETVSESATGFEVTMDTSVTTKFGFGTEYNGFTGGVQVNMKWVANADFTNSNTSSTEVSYTLSDQDPGDYFSVDVKRDKTYATPAFKVVAGASSCPHEDGTQFRDLPSVTIPNSLQQNVPLNSQAIFTVQLSNLSESMETRTYEVIVDPNSNLDGAVVRLAGQVITQGPATFTIPAGSGGSIMATMSVEAGPVAVDYNQLKLVIYSPCDPTISAEATFNVGFQSSCSPVTLFTPSNNWLINDASDLLRITYGGFNVNDTSLIQVGLQIRRTGQGWTGIAASVVSRTQLDNNGLPYYVMDINTASLPDGPYEIRAYADCNASGTRTFSVPLSGIIDRTSVTLLGTPSPADGTLNLNEEVSVTFSEDIDCSHFFNLQNITPYSVTLARADNGNAVPFTYTCTGDKILFTISPAALNALQNVLLTATVSGFYDVNGNVQQQPIVWSFVVNNSPVFWQPSGVNGSVATGGTSTLQGTLKNLSNAAQAFSLSSVPPWLSPAGVPASVAQGATLSVNFNISGAGLNPGLYTDTVYADFTGLGVQQPLYVQLNVYASSPTWTVTTLPAQMNIIANFSLNSGNTPLSIDANDRIGVFYGNQCRGVANIQYTPAGNTYAAYITVYGNAGAQPIETFEFRLWDASTATEYKAVETQAFVENAQVGQPLAPMILHPAGVVQRIPLATGWNWVSTYVIPNNPAVNDVLKYTGYAAGNTIKTNDSYAQYTANNATWYGTLTQIDWKKSYQVKVDAPTELQVIGQLLSDTVTLPVVAGWNWIGYPQSQIGTVTDYMHSFNSSDNDVLQSSTQFSTYAAGTWNGTLQNMQPGRGYKFKSAASGNILVAPRSTPGWEPDIFGNEFNMNVTAVVKANGTELMGNFIVGAFINGTCVGVSSLQYAGSMPRAFITLHGDAADNGQNLEFLIYDYNTDSIYTPTYSPLTFTTDAQQGNIETAYELNLENPLALHGITRDNFVLHQNIPNPFNGNTIIRFSMPREEHVSLQVYDYTGKLVRVIADGNYTAGEHTVDFNQNELSSGIYFYQMKAGSFTQTKKMMIQQ